MFLFLYLLVFLFCLIFYKCFIIYFCFSFCLTSVWPHCFVFLSSYCILGILLFSSLLLLVEVAVLKNKAVLHRCHFSVDMNFTVTLRRARISLINGKKKAQSETVQVFLSTFTRWRSSDKKKNIHRTGRVTVRSCFWWN